MPSRLVRASPIDGVVTAEFEVAVDARSAFLSRVSGWERYTRAITSICIEMPQIRILASRRGSSAGLVWSDQVELPAAARSARYVHFPSYPPGRAVPLRQSIYTLHDLTWWVYPETASRGGRTYYRPAADRAMNSALVLTVSHAMRAEIVDRWPRAEVRVVSPYVVDRGPRIAVKDPASRPYFLTVGSVEPRKNLAALARAFRASGLQDTHDLVVAGRPAWGAIPEGVRFLGAVTDDELESAYVGAQALFAPSLYEGFGLPVVEAMAVGLPVYCADIAAFREVTTGADPYLFDPLSNEAMVEAFRHAGAATPARRSPLSPYTRERTRGELIAAYQSLGLLSDVRGPLADAQP